MGARWNICHLRVTGSKSDNLLCPSGVIWLSNHGLLAAGTKPLPDPILTDHQYDLQILTFIHVSGIVLITIHENIFKDDFFSQIYTIFSMGQSVNPLGPSDTIRQGSLLDQVIAWCPHWIRKWLVAWRHQAITWTYVYFLLVHFCDIHMGAQWWPKLLLCIQNLKLILWVHHLTHQQYLISLMRSLMLSMRIDTFSNFIPRLKQTQNKSVITKV